MIQGKEVSMNVLRCADCVHYGGPLSASGESVPWGEYGVCRLAASVNGKPRSAALLWKADGEWLDEPKVIGRVPPMVAVDGNRRSAFLAVSPNFGCVAWEVDGVRSSYSGQNELEVSEQ